MSTIPYVLEWAGPFKSREDLKNWEKQQSEKFYLYMFQAKHKGKRKYMYYCGKAVKQMVHIRMGNSYHHLKEYEIERPDSIMIWVASFSLKNKVTPEDVSCCENMLISILHQLETDEDHNDNRTSFMAPNQLVYIINEWYTPEWNDYENSATNLLPNMIPDVIAFYPNATEKNLYACKQLKATSYLEIRR